MTRRVLYLMVLALAMELSSAAKRKSGLGVLILEKASVCPVKAKLGDQLKVHYEGRLKDGTVFEETFKIGRTTDITLGSSSVIKGWEEGLQGMCVGELRRLTVPPKLGYGDEGKSGKVPPGATLVFEIKMVAINDRYLHQIEAEAAEQEEAAAAAVELVLAKRAGERDSPYCDACNTYVEEFFESWIVMLQQQQDKVTTQDGGSRAPALTYNDDTELMVQSFCSNKTVGRIANSQFASFVRPACERIMLGHKREIVGTFLGSELAGKNVPDRKDQICADMVKACPHSNGVVVSGQCNYCQASIQDIAFEFRRRSPRPESKIEEEVYEVIRYICMRSYYRHRQKASSLQDYCDDIVDEYTKDIAEQVLSTIKGKQTWGDAERNICVDITESCPSSRYSENDEF